eukprot:8683682-Pyramimonas_sp.AAC.1
MPRERVLGPPLGNPLPHVHVIGNIEDQFALPLATPRGSQGHKREQFHDGYRPVLLGPRVAQH